ncbi:protein ABHD11 [Vigna radiata var. radiata]|uniref:Protein ABHD11 n=1 Tax=Vigna radiata var. radiata TaxID=3916 RepID=A0A1S3TN53_VIGRR|nr:protein ABHD11 [Vigna radiata var. radiata]
MAASLRIRNSSLLLTRFLNSATLPRPRWLQTVAYEELRANPEKPYTSTAVFIHGFLGSSRNWRSFSRNLLASLSNSSPSTNWRTVMLDMRNHGKSTERELNPPHNIESAAKDLADLVKAEGWPWPEVVVGHSMGGKVALQFAESCSRGDYGHSVLSPKQLWVLDSVPGKVNPENRNDEVRDVLATLQSLPKQFPSRKWLVSHLMELGYSKALSDWIGTNVKKVGDHETWIFDLENAKEMFDSYCEKSYWNLLEKPPKGMEIVILRAEKSDRWDQDAIERIQKLASERGSDSFGKVSFCVLPNAGHWVHVDNPKGLLEIMAPKILCS